MEMGLQATAPAPGFIALANIYHWQALECKV